MSYFKFNHGSLITPHIELKYLINSLSIRQHILFKTHYLGNTLDLVLLNSDSDICYGIPIISKLLIDHFTTTFRFILSNAKIKRALINNINLKTLNINDVSNDIINSLSNCNLHLGYFNRFILNILDNYSPIRFFLVTIHDNCP